MWNTIVSEPVGMESFPCQVPEMSWAETGDEKNIPAITSPVMRVTMRAASIIFIRGKIRFDLIVNIRYNKGNNFPHYKNKTLPNLVRIR